MEDIKYQPANRIIPFIITKLLNNEKVPLTKGEQKREFNYVDDLIDAILKSLIIKNENNLIFNVGCGKSIRINDIAYLISNILNKNDKIMVGELEYRPNEIWDMYCDNSLAKKILNWEPKTSLKMGLEKTIAWYETLYE